mgnify:CR=1 FL=1
MLTEDEIKTLVHRFYGRVRQDDILEPIFASHIHDWTTHLATMEDFWSSIANTSGRYKGHPMLAHMRLPGIAPAHFERWLSLFEETAAEVLPETAAQHVVSRAARIAESFKLGLGFYQKTPSERHLP